MFFFHANNKVIGLTSSLEGVNPLIAIGAYKKSVN